jgi:raffinose/stachyose/melibiose transport system substrate-binding protein
MKQNNISKIAKGVIFATLMAAGVGHLQAGEVSGEITFYTNRTDLVQAGEFKNWVDQFKAKYPKVTDVKVVGMADYLGGLRPRMNSGDFGDVVLILPSIPSTQYKQFYEPLDDLGYKDKIYFPDEWKDKSSDVSYGISSGNSVEGLVYNKLALTKAGVTPPLKTLTGLYEAADQLKKADIIPFYINFGAQWPLQQVDKLPLLIAKDALVYEKMLDQDKPFSGADAPYRKALTIFKTMIDKGWTEKDLMTNQWEDSKARVAQGKAAMYYLGNWVIPQVLTTGGGKAEDIGFMPIPVDDTGELKAMMGYDFAYAVSKFSKNKDTAKAFIKFMLEDSDFADKSGFIPTIKAREPGLAQLKEFMSYQPTIIPVKNNSPRFTEVGNRAKIDFYGGSYVQSVMLASNFEQALEQLDSRWNKARKRVK